MDAIWTLITLAFWIWVISKVVKACRKKAPERVVVQGRAVGVVSKK